MHTYMHTFIQTYIHTYVRTKMGIILATCKLPLSGITHSLIHSSSFILGPARAATSLKGSKRRRSCNSFCGKAGTIHIKATFEPACILATVGCVPQDFQT